MSKLRVQMAAGSRQEVGLPVGWANTKLSSLCNISTGKRDVNEGSPRGKYPFFTCAQNIYKIDEYEFDGKSILIAENGFFNVKYYDGKFNAYQRTYVLQNFQVNDKYLFRYISYRIDIITKNNRGSTIKYIRLGDLADHEVVVPPLNEQKRIAARLDEIIPRIDKVKKRLDKVPQIIKRFRQSVLTKAVTGKLTEDWRKEHADVESAEYLVNSVYKERLKSCATANQKSKIKKLYSELEKEDSSVLPATWQFTYLNIVCESFQYGTSSKSDKVGKIPVLRMGNIQNGRIDWNGLVYTSNKEEIGKYFLKNNTVLFNRTNSSKLVGKTAIYLGEKDAIFAGYLIRINNLKILDSHYLNYSLNTNYAQTYCNNVKTDGVNQSNINAQKLGRFEIPLPPFEEQKEIVRQVDKLFSLADKLESHYQKAKARVDKLSQSVLAKAFRGELVPQDSNDEPAEKLLERIMEEKAKMEVEMKKYKINSRKKKMHK